METNTKEERLIDQLLQALIDTNSPEIKTLVAHRFPDDDAWLCLWLAKKFIPKIAGAEIVFVNAGEKLAGSEGNPSILHFDTGGDEYDQHGKGFRRTSSAVLLAGKLGLLEKNPGLKPLLENATKVDNIEPLPPTDLHFLIEGYPRTFKDGAVDWKKVRERVFEDFDIIFGQETQRIQGRKSLQEFAVRTVLPNGIKVTSVLWHPELRDAAFEEGATVVIWTQAKGPNMFYTGIARNRRYDNLLYLDRVAAALRRVEAGARRIEIKDKNLLFSGNNGPLGNVWFLHDKSGFVANGTRTHKLADDDFTKLAPRQIVGIVQRTLELIPRNIVSSWNHK